MFAVRNYFFSTLIPLKEGSSERQEVFTFVKKVTKDLVEMKRLSTLPNPPFDYNRYDFVRSEATRISRDPSLMAGILSKTRFCTNKKCNSNPSCGFAHTIEEYNPPTCLQREFCKDESCSKNHVFTKAEYIDYYDVKVPQPDLGLKFTQFCNLMKEKKPCNMKECTFAHSLWEYRPLMCKFKNCTDQDCIRFHDSDTIFSYMEKQGVKFNHWMLRSTDMNNYIESKHLDFKEVLASLEFAEKIANEIKELESRNWQEEGDGKEGDGKEAGDDVQDGGDVQDDEDEPTFTIFGKKEFKMSQYLFEKEMKEYEEEEEEEEEEEDEEDEEEEEELEELEDVEDLMNCSAELGLDFETVFDMIEKKKQNVIFTWYKNFNQM